MMFVLSIIPLILGIGIVILALIRKLKPVTVTKDPEPEQRVRRSSSIPQEDARRPVSNAVR